MIHPEFGQLIEEMTFKVQADKATLWEEKMRLWVKPRPSWIPEKLWWKIVNFVLYQTVEKK